MCLRNSGNMAALIFNEGGIDEHIAYEVTVLGCSSTNSEGFGVCAHPVGSAIGPDSVLFPPKSQVLYEHSL